MAALHLMTFPVVPDMALIYHHSSNLRLVDGVAIIVLPQAPTMTYPSSPVPQLDQLVRCLSGEYRPVSETRYLLISVPLPFNRLMSFQNIYYKRVSLTLTLSLTPRPMTPRTDKKTTATARACFVCAKPTTACLATTNAIDFLYTCEAHLSDAGFATELVDPASAASASKPPAVSKEEIARVKAEWEAKEARKKTKESGKGAGAGKDESAGGGEGEKEPGEGGKNGAKSPSPSPPVPGGVSSSSSSSPTQTHGRYSLHRDFYAMRQAEHRRRRQTKQMQELAPRLPGAPHGSFSS